ncbi:PIN domain-containing protein [Leptospira sarikeiensis]|uniref:Type II toxin-antitoxin system VapC family toxin n=1 Tax=Leptospira sarikeiensis TaxID=2484943 RepID=A0A4V3JSH8_9LEPT|nr:PIN domain-containing protein [Leptospira sarikeiensis]TGL64906.1 type II toxin-antitoxin system VapC family toxin [Leptospira sarikeiensis]
MLVDSDILIDYLRGFKEAIFWLHSIQGRAYISGYTYFELVEGCHTALDLKRVEKFLTAFEILWLDEMEIQKALDLFKNHKFKLGNGFVDCLIGQTSIYYKKTLYTFNIKHYRVLSEIQVLRPFEKRKK